MLGVPRVRVLDAPRVVRPDELDRPALDVLLLREPGGEDVRVAMTPNVGHRHSSHTDHTAVSALDRTAIRPGRDRREVFPWVAGPGGGSTLRCPRGRAAPISSTPLEGASVKSTQVRGRPRRRRRRSDRRPGGPTGRRRRRARTSGARAVTRPEGPRGSPRLRRGQRVPRHRQGVVDARRVAAVTCFPSSRRQGRAAKADAFLRQYARAFGAPYGQLVRDASSRRTATARPSATPSATSGVPVFGAMLRASIDKDGDLTSVERRRSSRRDLSDHHAARVGARQAARRARWRWCAPSRPAPRDGKKVDTRGLKAASTKLVVYRHGLHPGRRRGQHRARLPGRGDQPEEHPRHRLHLRQRRQGRQPLLADRRRARPRRSTRPAAAATATPSSRRSGRRATRSRGSLNVDQQNMVTSTGEAYWLFKQRLRP